MKYIWVVILVVSFEILANNGCVIKRKECNFKTCATYNDITIFVAGEFLPYHDAVQDCLNKGGRPFLPNTETDNHIIAAYEEKVLTEFEISRNEEILREGWYPKIFRTGSDQYVWADGQVYDDFFKVGDEINDAEVRENNLELFSQEEICFYGLVYSEEEGFNTRVISCSVEAFYVICQFIKSD